MRRLIGLFALALATGGAAQQPPPSPAARAAWGFDRTDLAPDPAIRFGVLPNGMRYAIQRSRQPPGGLSIRLHVAVGAAMGTTGEAHFIEHLAFHGSAHFPQGAAAWLEQRLRLERGRDFNGTTSLNSTIYGVDLRRDGQTRLDLMLRLFRDMVLFPDFGAATIERTLPGLIDEAAMREGPDYRREDDIAAFIAPDSPYGRSLGGSEAELRAIDAEALRRFHARYYKARRITLIVVGDVDPAMVERRIAARFADLPAGADEPDPPPIPLATDRPTSFRLVQTRGGSTWVTVAALTPDGAGADGAGARDDAHLASLGADMLERRVTGYRGGDRPFVDAEAYVQNHYGLARIARFSVRVIDRDWQAALGVAESELRRALLHGFTQAELDAALRIEGERLAGLAAPRSSAELVDWLVALVSGDIVPTAPAGPSDGAAWLARIRLDAVNAAFRAAYGRGGLLVHLAHDRAIEGGEARMAAVWRASAARPVAAQ